MTFLSWISSKMPTSLSHETFDKLTQPLVRPLIYSLNFLLYDTRLMNVEQNFTCHFKLIFLYQFC